MGPAFKIQRIEDGKADGDVDEELDEEESVKRTLSCAIKTVDDYIDQNMTEYSLKHKQA